jgi:hypothetical protein
MLMKANSFIILILLSFCQCKNDSMIEFGRLSVSKDTCLPKVSETYNYPITPGMEEWQKSDDVYKLVQLPAEVLKSISTSGLIDALVNSPLFAGAYLLSSSSSPVDTWQRHYERFNCAEELFQRKDAGDALIAYYNLVCFDCFKLPSVNVLKIKEQIMGLEFLFTKQAILDKITHIKRQELVSLFLTNYNQMPDDTYRVFPIIWILHADKYSPMMDYYQDKAELFQSILSGYISPTNDQINLIISFAERFINDKS